MKDEMLENPVEKNILPVEKNREFLPSPKSTSEQEIEEMKRADEKAIAAVRRNLGADEPSMPAKTAVASLSASEGNMQVSINTDAARVFLAAQGLSEEQIKDFKIEFTKLRWSNETTRLIAAFLPGRLREIFTRIELLKGDTLKIFTNNLDAIYVAEDKELIARDTIHHLAHFAQRKKGISGIMHLFTRLPIIHGLSKYEKEARKLAREADLKDGQLANLVEFSNKHEKPSNSRRLKIEV